MVFTILLLADTVRKVTMLFFACGLCAYLIDYRASRKKTTDPREAAFSKTVSLIYIYGSITVFIVTFAVAWIV